MTSTTPTRPSRGGAGIPSDTLLARFAERAPQHDRANEFVAEDFEELRECGYLRLPLPREFGGPGLDLAAVVQEQRRLAYSAAPTALAVNMHLYWVGLAADLWRAGDRSLGWLLQAAADGEVFAAGHAESGNDFPGLASTTRAVRVEGGYRFTGRKHFGSLSPVWTTLGIHGLDENHPDGPRIVHGFIPRDTAGLRIERVWDAVGMRGTGSEDTILQDAFVPDRLVARVVAPGTRGVDRFVLGIFGWALLGFGNIYLGLARRMFDLTVAGLRHRRSVTLPRGVAQHPGIQHRVAEMALILEAIEPQLDRVAGDWSAGVDHGAMWPAKILSAKYQAVEGAWKVADTALDLAGGFGVLKAAGMERLWRDARLGRVHPGNSLLTHELVAKSHLGIDPDAEPRWG